MNVLCPQHPEATAFVGARFTMEEQWGSMVEWARAVRSGLSATGAEDLQDWALVNRGYTHLHPLPPKYLYVPEEVVTAPILLKGGLISGK